VHRAVRRKRAFAPMSGAAHSLHSVSPCPHLRRKHTPQIVPGELTIVTGIPNSGKSEWIDALLCNLSEAEGWSFALCSMEKKVR